jgi:chemotaxis protein histidine kinase CheA
MTDDEKEQSRIKEKYEKQIETAKELIKSKYPEVKAEAEQLLAQLQGQLEQEVKDLIIKQRILAEAEYATLRAEIEAKVEEERTKRKEEEAKELFDYNEYLGTKSDNEMDELTRKYKLIYEYAKSHNLDLVSLEQAHLTKLTELSDKNNKDKVTKEKKTKEQEIKAKSELEQAQISIMQEGVSALVEVVGKKTAIGKALFAFEQGLAIAKIYTHMQEELAIIRLQYAANPLLSTLFQGIAYAKGIAGAIKVGSLAVKEYTLPQKAKGGYHNVIGQDDKRNYHAQFIGQRSTGMLPAHPSLVIAGERGPEYFVDNETLSTPQGGWHVRALENIRQGRAVQLPQFAEGGYTSATPAQVPTNGTILVATADLALLNSTLSQLVTILQGGLGVTIGYPQIADISKGIERIKGL